MNRADRSLQAALHPTRGQPQTDPSCCPNIQPEGPKSTELIPPLPGEVLDFWNFFREPVPRSAGAGRRTAASDHATIRRTHRRGRAASLATDRQGPFDLSGCESLCFGDRCAACLIGSIPTCAAGIDLEGIIRGAIRGRDPCWGTGGEGWTGRLNILVEYAGKDGC